MPKVETNRSDVVARLKAEGWISEGGTNHEIFARLGRKGKLQVPRHRTLSIGVARQLAKAAGWI